MLIPTQVYLFADSMAFYAKDDPKRTNIGQLHKKERPICTYYGYVGHLVDKCYKLHECPPGYKTKPKFASSCRSCVNNQSNSFIANQISESISYPTQGNVGDFMQTLNRTQYQHLMNTLSE